MKSLLTYWNYARGAVPRILRDVAEHIFLSFLLLFFFALLIAGLVWYVSFYGTTIGTDNFETVFYEDKLLELIRIQEDRALRIETVISKEYQDIFFPKDEID